jgi:acyl-CoA synthetase (AMP-forming)/AMP-acid ligase II
MNSQRITDLPPACGRAAGAGAVHAQRLLQRTARQRTFGQPGRLLPHGDRVRRSADGYLEVTGRVKDVILRGGESVSALDLEEHLLTHPSIWAAAAVPLPDDYLGEKICAAVVFTGPPVTLAELDQYLDRRGVAAHARGHAGADAGPAHDRSRQDRQESDRQGNRRIVTPGCGVVAASPRPRDRPRRRTT